MPPRRRKRDAAASASPSPTREPSPHESDASPVSPSANSTHDDGDPPRFFNTTFTTYRASPLHIGKQALTPERLQILSRRLRDTLVGDVVRGVQVGLEGDAALGRTGALYAVDWRWINAERILGSNQREGSIELGYQSEDGPQNRRRRVLCIELRYENARFSALLLPKLDTDEGSSNPSHLPSWTWQADNTSRDEVDQSAFLHLPLLLFRMPAPLKSVLIDFLSSAFDCRINPLALGTRTLVGSWEAWLSHNDSGEIRRVLNKDILITLGFHIEPSEPKSKGSGASGEIEGSEDQVTKLEAPQLGLKSIDIAIPASDAYRFLRAGTNIVDESRAAVVKKRKADATTVISDEQQDRRRRKLAGGRDEEGWAWRSQGHSNDDRDTERLDETTKQPFTEALAAYIWHHLGLDMYHPSVRVLRVACDGFALSEGRLKVFAPAGGRNSNDEEKSSTWKLMRGLVQRARGNPKWGIWSEN
ncbi:kinetochore complex Sim4 subunit Fta1-domain-containing protein [Hypoxylon trugodes]|uniref:kinetochore complex Sim4 subunit Fta1-domain-containing protein n=1 Tax=Hypoxylon trugodes TaxID=326681 RepID=UPI002197EAC4|nr:kinetochore complex Sim4 subunit Fta1-domain-containing protein [Hypoxylon trugodes]KAI1383810.1 kinetochore complex Sim4 subunit Fta1-domain-containing protein [Hypoxylon trugodes]